MSRFPDHLLDDIRRRVPLSSRVGKVVTWDKAKSNPAKGDYWGCCPFHGEKTSSFHVDDGKGFYHCFGCRASGDLFAWVMDREGVDFPRAVESLARDAGVALPAQSEGEKASEKRRVSLRAVMAAAAGFYRAALEGEGGEMARGWCEGRGLDAETRERFGIGFAPLKRGALNEAVKAAAKCGDAELLEAGLTREANAPPFIDRDAMSGRIVFPIQDSRGGVIGFAGRVTVEAEGVGKYLNTAETPLFSKGRVLWNWHRARDASRAAGKLLLVEGYMDAIAFDRAGMAHVAAPMGTALTEHQLADAWRFCAEPTLCFDGDEAGAKAQARAIDLALSMLAPGKSLQFARLSDGKDPDDIFGEGGAEALAAAVAKPEPLSAALWAALTDGAIVDTPERCAAFQAAVAARVAVIPDEGVRKHYEADLTARLKAFWKAKGLKPPPVKFEKKPKDDAADGDGAGGGAAGWGDDLREKMNRDYAVVIMGQKALILRDGQTDAAHAFERFSLMSVDGFGVWMKNRRVWHHGRQIGMADLWLSDPGRRQYRGMEFKPGAPGEDVERDGYYNLWRGYGVEPKPDDALARPFFAHIEEVIASGDTAVSDWIVQWFAAKIQKPRERIGTSLVLRGVEGTGKTMLGKIFGSLLPANYYLVDDPRYLTGQFNAHLASCSFLQVDEGFWAGDKGAEGRLKGLITSDFQMIEFKGIDPVRLPNYVTMMISSNEDWIVPVAPKGRRYAVIDVSPVRARDTDYFKALAAHFERPEAKAALLQALMDVTIDFHALRRVPSTDALFAQKVRTFDPVQQFVLETLQKGAVGDGVAWPPYVKCSDFHALYLKRCERYGVRHILAPESFGRQIFAFMPGLIKKRRREGEGPSQRLVTVYQFGGLQVMRDDFAFELGHKIDWGDGLEEMGPDAPDGMEGL